MSGPVSPLSSLPAATLPRTGRHKRPVCSDPLDGSLLSLNASSPTSFEVPCPSLCWDFP